MTIIEKNDLLLMIVCYILTCYLTVPRENSITGKTSDLTKNSKPGDLAKHVKSKLNKLRRKPLASKGPQVRHLLCISNIDTHYYFNLFVLGAELLGKSPCILLFQRPLKCLTNKWFRHLKFAKSWLRFPWKKNIKKKKLHSLKFAQWQLGERSKNYLPVYISYLHLFWKMLIFIFRGFWLLIRSVNSP